ncbi:hypothetical protein XENTR_v10020291 [Xenopus tropicalis]|nr:hypothetical protein XENTR_v10020291 [Xenopus tropicalis]
MEQPEIPGKNTCQEENTEPDLKPAIENCRETPEILDMKICQDEEVTGQESPDTGPCHSQEPLEEQEDPPINTCEVRGQKV